MSGYFVDYFLELYHWSFVTSWKKTGELFAINKVLLNKVLLSKAGGVF